MAEMMKDDQGSKTGISDVRSRVQSAIGQVQEKAGEVSHEVVETFQENKALTYIGLGLLLAGAGIGIWAIFRKKSGFEVEEFGGREDFRRSSQY